MFSASFIMHAWGNDITSGAIYPYNEAVFTAAPLGNDCQDADPYTPNGVPNDRYCGPTTHEQGHPITGMGTLVSGGATVGASVALPQSAFSGSVTGFLPTYYPLPQSWTYATIANEAADFFASGGPAASGTITKVGKGQTIGSWIISPRPGGNALGGVMGLLGKYGAVGGYFVTGKVGTYEGTSSWAIIPPMGRHQYATPIAYSPMGKVTGWQNPYVKTDTWVNNYNSNTSKLQARGTGTPWTTGAVAVYAQAGVFQTILHRTGFDTTSMEATPMGSATVRNIQLVTPTLTHWIGPGYQTHTGQIGILNLRLVPEPGHVALLTVGIAALVLMQRVVRHR